MNALGQSCPDRRMAAWRRRFRIAITGARLGPVGLAGGQVGVPVYDITRLPHGAPITGPAVIEGDIMVPMLPGDTAMIGKRGVPDIAIAPQGDDI